MKKRILSLLMAVCLMTTLVSVCSVSASAAEGDVYVYAYNARAKAGETVEIPFYINSEEEIRILHRQAIIGMVILLVSQSNALILHFCPPFAVDLNPSGLRTGE